MEEGRNVVKENVTFDLVDSRLDEASSSTSSPSRQPQYEHGWKDEWRKIRGESKASQNIIYII